MSNVEGETLESLGVEVYEGSPYPLERDAAKAEQIEASKLPPAAQE